MAIIYILHEIYDQIFKVENIEDLGKKFARIAIISFLIYYLVYFYFPIGSRERHFFKRLIIVDVLSSVVFYGGLLKTAWFWLNGETKKEPLKEPIEDPVEEKVVSNNSEQFLCR